MADTMTMNDTAADPGATGSDAFAYGSLGEHAWDFWEREAEPTAEEALETFLEWVEDRGIELWAHQEEALLDLAAGNHVILGTPTGSGKSMVALGQIFTAICCGRRAYYTAPIKALVSEKFFNLVDYLGRDNVGMITGDTQINPGAPVICCTAEILANQALREGASCDVGFVAMDEFHYFADPERGWAWQVPLLILRDTQFLLMSATLGDTSQIASSLKARTGRDVDMVVNAPRPVPLSYEYVETPLEGTVEIALRNGDAPIYIVHAGQDAALTSAQSLASYGVATKEQRDAIKDAIKGARFSTAFGRILQRLLGCGVGVHHAGMLPRYRLLVEKLAQKGLLPVICGTDTLGVGINVPIHTVIMTQLTKFDGHRVRRLRAREFHQVAGRAGRSGFDTEGLVIAEAPEHDIENAKALMKCGGDPKKERKLKRKQPPEGFVGWSKDTFAKLQVAVPETLTPRFKVTHSMVLAMVDQGGDAWQRVIDLIDESAQPDTEKTELKTRASEVFATLIDAGVVVRTEDADGTVDFSLTVDLPQDFALDQPLSPFLLAALELLDPLDPDYALDVVSMVEATLEDPRQILRIQEKRAKDAAMAQMKADEVEYDERIERLADVTYPRPLEDLLEPAFHEYCKAVPWANDFRLRPKSVLRDMLESCADFKSYVSGMNIARYEGILLRYLSDAFRVLARTVPIEKRDERLTDTIAWLDVVVRSVDSSLIDEWAKAGTDELLDVAPPMAADEVVRDRRGLTVLVRNALMRRVTLMAREATKELGTLDMDWGWGELKWRKSCEEFFDAHEEVLLDGDARSAAFFHLDESDEKTLHVWHAHQIVHDVDGDHDFGIMADIDLDATQENDGVVFKNYRVGFIEDLLGK